MGQEMGGRFKREGISVYIWLIHVEVSQKMTKFYKAINLKLKKKNKKKKKGKNVVQFSSVTPVCWMFCDPMDCSTPGLPVYHQLLEFTQTHIHRVGDAIQPSHPLLFPSPPTFNLSQHQGFANESVLRIKWPKYCIFSFSISPFNEYSGLISFRMDWLNLLAIQGTCKSVFQHQRSKASIL